MRSIQILLIISLISGAFWFLNQESSERNKPSAVNENKTKMPHENMIENQKVGTNIASTNELDHTDNPTVSKNVEHLSRGPSLETNNALNNGGPSDNVENNIIPTAPEDSYP